MKDLGTVDQQRAMLEEAHGQGRVATLKAYARLSGPGWLQSALSLGGGSLDGVVFLKSPDVKVGLGKRAGAGGF